MTKKSRFERLEQAATKIAFEVLGNEKYPSKKIIGTISCDADTDGTKVKTQFFLRQIGSCGSIFLDQRQGLILAEQLQKLFSQGG